ncbi:MAG: hypothetical protein JW874_03585 [Spirochaetales bacterium]|nr:hypothetical protein [Spirochaetales bacterium]
MRLPHTRLLFFILFVPVLFLITANGCFLPPEDDNGLLMVTISENTSGILTSTMYATLTMTPEDAAGAQETEKTIALNDGGVLTAFTGLASGTWGLGFELYDSESGSDPLTGLSIPLGIEANQENHVEINVDYEYFSDKYIIKASQISTVTGPEFNIDMDAVCLRYFDRAAGTGETSGFVMTSGFVTSGPGLLEVFYPDDGYFQKDFDDLAVPTPAGYFYTAPFMVFAFTDSGQESGSFSLRLTDEDSGYFEMASENASAFFAINTNETSAITLNGGAENLPFWSFTNPEYVHTWIIIFCHSDGTNDLFLSFERRQNMDATFFVPGMANLACILAFNGEHASDMHSFNPDLYAYYSADPEVNLEELLVYLIINFPQRFNGIAVYRTDITLN